MKLSPKETPSDGNCFFHAVADQSGIYFTATELRKNIVDFMTSNPVLWVILCREI